MVLKLGHFGKSTRNTWNVLKCGAGDDHLDRSCKKWGRFRGVKEERNIIRTIKRRKANWIGHILRWNCLLKHIIEGKRRRGGIEVTVRRGGRRKQLLDGRKERTRDCKLKEEALDRSLWRTRFGRGCGPVLRQTAEWMNEWNFTAL